MGRQNTTQHRTGRGAEGSRRGGNVFRCRVENHPAKGGLHSILQKYNNVIMYHHLPEDEVEIDGDEGVEQSLTFWGQTKARLKGPCFVYTPPSGSLPRVQPPSPATL